MKPIGTHNYFVYILTNKNKTVLFVGITEDLKKRLYYHQSPISEPNRIPFTTKYACYYIVYFERFEDVSQAIDREKQIKKWSRLKKESLINAMNPEWRFLNEEI